MLIVTFGAEGRAVDDLTALVARQAVDHVFDLRLTPGGRDGRNGPWSGAALMTALGTRYIWFRELAVRNLRTGLAAGEAPRFVDLEGGIKKLVPYLVRDRAWVFLGDAQEPMHDARGHLAAKVCNDLEGVIVVHDRFVPPATQEGLW